jgi:hypothetical protein
MKNSWNSNPIDVASWNSLEFASTIQQWYIQVRHWDLFHNVQSKAIRTAGTVEQFSPITRETQSALTDTYICSATKVCVTRLVTDHCLMTPSKWWGSVGGVSVYCKTFWPRKLGLTNLITTLLIIIFRKLKNIFPAVFVKTVEFFRKVWKVDWINHVTVFFLQFLSKASVW